MSTCHFLVNHTPLSVVCNQSFSAVVHPLILCWYIFWSCPPHPHSFIVHCSRSEFISEKPDRMNQPRTEPTGRRSFFLVCGEGKPLLPSLWVRQVFSTEVRMERLRQGRRAEKEAVLGNALGTWTYLHSTFWRVSSSSAACQRIPDTALLLREGTGHLTLFLLQKTAPPSLLDLALQSVLRKRSMPPPPALSWGSTPPRLPSAWCSMPLPPVLRWGPTLPHPALPVLQRGSTAPHPACRWVNAFKVSCAPERVDTSTVSCAPERVDVSTASCALERVNASTVSCALERADATTTSEGDLKGGEVNLDLATVKLSTPAAAWTSTAATAEPPPTVTAAAEPSGLPVLQSPGLTAPEQAPESSQCLLQYLSRSPSFPRLLFLCLCRPLRLLCPCQLQSPLRSHHRLQLNLHHRQRQPPSLYSGQVLHILTGSLFGLCPTVGSPCVYLYFFCYLLPRQLIVFFK